MTDKQQAYANKLVKEAEKLGALTAKAFELKDIVFDSRTLLKCMFGCGDWGSGHTCPSANPHVSMAEYKEMFSRYTYGIIVHADNKKTNHDISFLLESKAFTDGYHFAFSLSDCALCKTCAGFDGDPCRFVKKARPAFHSVGIDVFTTVRRLGMPIETLSTEDDPQNWYAAVFVE